MVFKIILLIRKIIIILDLFFVNHVFLFLKLGSFILGNEKFEIHFFVVVITYSFHFIEFLLDIWKDAEGLSKVGEYCMLKKG